MRRLDIASAKVSVVFPEGKLPAIDPADPAFVLVLGGVEIAGKVNPKAARKLAAHTGGAVLQGKLVVEGGKLTLLDAGFSWIEPKAAEEPLTPAASSEAALRRLEELRRLAAGGRPEPQRDGPAEGGGQ
jgi:hypothetical protein